MDQLNEAEQSVFLRTVDEFTTTFAAAKRCSKSEVLADAERAAKNFVLGLRPCKLFESAIANNAGFSVEQPVSQEPKLKNFRFFLKDGTVYDEFQAKGQVEANDIGRKYVRNFGRAVEITAANVNQKATVESARLKANKDVALRESGAADLTEITARLTKSYLVMGFTKEQAEAAAKGC